MYVGDGGFLLNVLWVSDELGTRDIWWWSGWGFVVSCFFSLVLRLLPPGNPSLGETSSRLPYMPKDTMEDERLPMVGLH